MKRIFSILACTIMIVAASSCINEPTPDGECGLLSFGLSKALNSSLPADITGVIDASAKTVTLTIPTSVTTTSFVPSFVTTEFDEVVIGNTTLDGVSAVTITDGTIIKVSDIISNLEISYKIVVKSNDEKAELLSVVFAKADNADLTEDVAPAEIASEMLVRVPAAAFQKELIIKAAAGQNDVIKINGEVAADGSATVDTMFPIDITVTDEIAGTSTDYVVKVGKILSIVLKNVGSFQDGTLDKTIDMRINPKDNLPYIVYGRKTDADEYKRAALVKWDGNVFSAVGDVITPDVKAATHPALAFDGEGVPYVKYVGGDVASVNSVRKFNGATWDLVGEAGATQIKVNTSYDYPIFFQPGSNYPSFFFNCNTKNTAEYRIMNLASFDGTAWNSTIVSSAPALGSGDTANSGMFYGADWATDGSKLYIVGSFNEMGFYVFEATGNNAMNPVVNNVFPENEKCALPGNIGISIDGNGVPYIFEALWAQGKMQIYKVDVNAGTVTPYGATFPVSISTSGGVNTKAAFGVNPQSGMVISVVDGETAPKFQYLDENLQWAAFESDFTVPAASNYSVKFDSNGCGYIAFTTADDLQLFTIDFEDDIIPE